ncbi:PHA/PHB synthase family protein [Candidatus Cyrtobacter comes]|nr:alpha/beta fold hydrolase [Candidatus Cyrtobacter comes]
MKNNLSLYNQLQSGYTGFISAFFQGPDLFSNFAKITEKNLEYYKNFCTSNSHSADLSGALEFYNKVIIDLTSPEKLASLYYKIAELTISSNGQNILDGAENFLQDAKKSLSKKLFTISTVQDDLFEVGVNLAITKGKVVFQNELLQIIQYEPATDEVKEIPILFIPAWINKFYILDLQEKNSMVRWLTQKGYRVFVISWINPDATYKNTGFEDYMIKGAIAAINAVKKIASSTTVSCVGYCMGGTLLSATLSYLAKIKDKSVSSATFLCSLLDFEEVGRIAIFINENQVSFIEKIMERDGYFDGSYIASVFSLLRPNDMMWEYFVNNYLMGNQPSKLDLLFWNNDNIRIPAKMHSYCLRNMYMKNLLSKPNGLSINGKGIDFNDIKIPVYIFAAKEDHICPWKSVFKAAPLFNGERRLVLGGSGHIAGIINHPDRNKYWYSILESDLDENSNKHEGSWWLDWSSWLSTKLGKNIEAKGVVDAGLGEAPGSYVKM